RDGYSRAAKAPIGDHRFSQGNRRGMLPDLYGESDRITEIVSGPAFVFGGKQPVESRLGDRFPSWRVKPVGRRARTTQYAVGRIGQHCRIFVHRRPSSLAMMPFKISGVPPRKVKEGAESNVCPRS